jgi:primosomal protein N' (replication factor Y) (superfamily II helicase)
MTLTDATAAAPGPAPPLMAVLLPLPVAGPYTYRVPAALATQPGDFVLVPLGKRRAIGVVWGAADQAIAEGRLKAALARLDAPPMPANLRRFVDWVADYNFAAPGAVLRMCLAAPDALEAPPARLGWVLAAPAPPAPLAAPPPGLRMTAARRRVLAVLADGRPRATAELAEIAGAGVAVVQGLAVAGALTSVPLAEANAFPPPDVARQGPALSPPQIEAAAALVGAVDAGAYSVTVLEGVTGAGKTEVYFEAIAQAIRRGKQVLVLLPEIALTAQWLDRFVARFGVRPAVWHSDLGKAHRRRVWRAVADGGARLVVGARSALFLPFPELGLIVVDEEHDASYKQEEGVIYNARDMAVVRAKLAGVPAILVSATPSLETVVNCQRGRYRRLQLPERFAGASLPAITALDLRQFPPPPRRFLSPPLVAAIGETIKAGGQAMLYLNRRGYAPLTLCGHCGHRMRCPNCTAWLVEHRRHKNLLCHHCGHHEALPNACPACAAEGALRACGPGVERLAEEVAADFPAARVAVMASDTITGPAAAADLVHRIVGGQVDLIIGTQIVAKGHHFPKLALVGVVDADLGLAGGDLRAAERTFQLLTQVAGRAGRESQIGRAILQTFMPEHPVMQAIIANDAAGFIAAEAESRRAAAMPPFGRLAALIVSSTDQEKAAAAARDLARRAPRQADVAVLGPAPAPLARLRGRHRFRLLLKAGRDTDLQAVLHAWLGPIRLPNAVRLAVDVDPYSFL